MFIIEDWAGNRLFPDKEFDTFEDGWDFLYVNIPDEGSFCDIFVVEKD